MIHPMCGNLQIPLKLEAQAKIGRQNLVLRLRFRLQRKGFTLAVMTFSGVLWLLPGCASDDPHIDRSCTCDCIAQKCEIAKDYLVYCPDVLELAIDSRTELTGVQAIGLDGRISLGPAGLLRVEGLPVSDIAGEIAEVLKLPADKVRVRVAEYKSQQIFLFGQVVGLQHAVPYRGPEPVSELLRRVGGITEGAAPGKIYIVRPGLVEGGQPQVFHIDLKSILVTKDQRTNIRLQPFDQIFVGENKPFSVMKCIPPILRPLYETVCGLRKERGPDTETRRVGEGETTRRGDTEGGIRNGEPVELPPPTLVKPGR
jgi:protein involved in polysaccharide export with SLBB domain